MNRVSIGTWAYSVGPYADNPVPFGEVVKGLKEMGFDGLELGAFGAHPTPDNHPTKQSRQTLRDLVDWGLVRRRDYREVPPRVEYSLTRLGTSLVQTIAAFDDWVIRHYDEVAEARRRLA